MLAAASSAAISSGRRRSQCSRPWSSKLPFTSRLPSSSRTFGQGSEYSVAGEFAVPVPLAELCCGSWLLPRPALDLLSPLIRRWKRMAAWWSSSLSIFASLSRWIHFSWFVFPSLRPSLSSSGSLRPAASLPKASRILPTSLPRRLRLCSLRPRFEAK